MTKTSLPSHFSRAVGIRIFCLKREDIGNIFQICNSNDLLNMYSEPFVMALNVLQEIDVRLSNSASKTPTVRAIFFLGHFCRYKFFNNRDYFGLKTDPHVINSKTLFKPRSHDNFQGQTAKKDKL